MCVVKVLAILVMIVFVVHNVAARPNRLKRTSDQHLAEIETKMGMRNLNGVAVTLPIGAGIDLKQIGRKRRSQNRILDTLFNRSLEEDSQEALTDADLDDILYRYRLNLLNNALRQR